MPLATSHSADFDDPVFRTALEKLQRWEAKNNGHQSEKRMSIRHSYENKVTILAVSHQPKSHGPGKPAEESTVTFPVFARNLSRSGMSFIMTRDILPTVLKDDVTPIQIDALLEADKRLRVGLQMRNEQVMWMTAKVVRFRPIHDGLFECGVQFLSKADGAAL